MSAFECRWVHVLKKKKTAEGGGEESERKDDEESHHSAYHGARALEGPTDDIAHDGMDAATSAALGNLEATFRADQREIKVRQPPRATDVPVLASDCHLLNRVPLNCR